MDYELIFYVSGGVLAASAVVFTFLGLKMEKFPGKAGSAVAVYFIALAAVASTFAVLHSQHEEEHREHEAGIPQASKEAEAEEH
jgi:hypothetical protein